MLIVDVTVTLFLRWPAVFVVLAAVIWALPRTFVCLEMFGQVTRTLELLVAERTFVNLWLGVLLAACHGPKGLFVGVEGLIHGTLHGGGGKLLR